MEEPGTAQKVVERLLNKIRTQTTTVCVCSLRVGKELRAGTQGEAQVAPHFCPQAWRVLRSGRNFPRPVTGLGPGQPPTNILMNNTPWP